MDDFGVCCMLSLLHRGSFHPNSPRNLVYSFKRHQTGNKHLSSSTQPVPADTVSQSHRSLHKKKKLLQLHAQATKTPHPHHKHSLPRTVHGGSNKDTNSRDKNNSHSKRAIHKDPAQEHNHCSFSRNPQRSIERIKPNRGDRLGQTTAVKLTRQKHFTACVCL